MNRRCSTDIDSFTKSIIIIIMGVTFTEFKEV